jgi:photosystem II stability/assembly factor-like uncharacterized protein
MRIQLALLCVALAATGCRKGTGGGTGGGGGGWLVGSSGLMANIKTDQTVGAGYDPGSSAQLNSIACRYSGEAWVAGGSGTLLYTNDAGATWTAQAVPTTADLRAIATQDDGPVFVAGVGTMLESDDTGATWRQLGTASFRSVAAAQEAGTVLAISDDGAVWSFDGATLTTSQTLPGARAVAVASGGQLAMVAGAGLWRSIDAGVTWTQLAVDPAGPSKSDPLHSGPAVIFDDVRIDESGNAVAVGAGGTVANIDATGAVAIQRLGGADLHTLHIADFDSGAATGYAAGEGGQVWITSDAGKSWTLGPNLGRTVFGVDEIGDGHR